MNKTSIASLQERLADWTSWDMSAYHLGACLGFFPEFGAPPGFDPWHGMQKIICSDSLLGDVLSECLIQLSCINMLEQRENPVDQDVEYRWNIDYNELNNLIV